MTIHDDPVARNLARLFGHTKKKYDHKSKFHENIKNVCQEIEIKFERKINKHTIIGWMIDGSGHRYPKPELLTLVANALEVRDVWDLYIDEDRWKRVDNLNSLAVEIIKKIPRLTKKQLGIINDMIDSMKIDCEIAEEDYVEENSKISEVK